MDLSKIREGVERAERELALHDSLTEASRRLGTIEGHVRRLQQSHTDLLNTLRAVWAERVNIGLDKPFWTPGLAELIEPVIVQAEKETKP